MEAMMFTYNVILRAGGKLTIESDAADPKELARLAMTDDGWLVTPLVAIRAAEIAAIEVPSQDRRTIRARNSKRPPKGMLDTY